MHILSFNLLARHLGSGKARMSLRTVGEDKITYPPEKVSGAWYPDGIDQSYPTQVVDSGSSDE